MIEITLVVSGVVAVGIVGVMASLVTPHLMTELGLWTLLIGLVTGVPTGFWYHVVLYRVLARKMTVPARWWLAPVDLDLKSTRLNSSHSQISYAVFCLKKKNRKVYI